MSVLLVILKIEMHEKFHSILGDIQQEQNLRRAPWPRI